MKFIRLNPRDTTRVTVSYADIFDYPLSVKDLEKWALIGSTVTKKVKGIEYKNGHVFLKGRSVLFALRQQCQSWQKEKWAIAERASLWLSLLPTIELIGVTGGLVMNNAKREDDIDLFIISSHRTIWITRLLAILIMNLLGLRRKPEDIIVTNKVCLNMFMAPKYARWSWGVDLPISERDCFSAHEVLQMKPLYARGNAYRYFIRSNEWVSAYLPNAWKDALKRSRGLREEKYIYTFLLSITRTPFRIFEPYAKFIQLLYMQSHRTHEVITDVILRFHPTDARRWVKRKFAERLKAFKIPLDKIFYAR
jgi:hypothetical protein